jgi:hypothetical protein
MIAVMANTGVLAVLVTLALGIREVMTPAEKRPMAFLTVTITVLVASESRSSY